MPLPSTLTSFLITETLPPDPDIRDRTTPEYAADRSRLGADIQAHGLLTPLLAYVDKAHNRPRILDGGTRREVLLLIGHDQPVPCMLYPERPEAAVLPMLSLQCNAMRRDMSDIEYASVYQQLMTLNNWSPAELFRQLHINPGTGHKRLAISKNLCPQVQAWVSDGTVAVRAAYSLSRLKDHAQQVELAEKYRQQIVCAEGVESEVARVLNGGKRVKAAKPITAKCDGVLFEAKPDTTLEVLATAFEKLAAVARKLIKEKRGVEYLPLELRSL